MGIPRAGTALEPGPLASAVIFTYRHPRLVVGLLAGLLRVVLEGSGSLLSLEKQRNSNPPNQSALSQHSSQPSPFHFGGSGFLNAV